MRRDRLVTVAAAVAIAAAAIFSMTAPVSATSTTRVPVLMYHLIVENPPPTSTVPDLYVTPEAFDAELGALWARGWHTITAAALGEAIRARREVPARSFVISFDDGHADGWTTAWPIMQKYGFVGTFYVVPGHIGGAGFLTWDMVAALARAGNEIANHTMDHVSLPSYHGAALATQVDDAARAIEDQLAVRGVATTVTSFAYPYGQWSLEAMALLAWRGYTLAVTTVFGTGSTRGAEPLLYPRVRVSRGESVQTFLANVGGVTLIDWRGPLPSASRPPTAASGSRMPAPSASAPPSDAAIAAASPVAASLDTAVGADLTVPTEAPRHAPDSLGTSASTDELLVVGGLGIVVVLLLTAAATVRWRRR